MIYFTESEFKMGNKPVFHKMDGDFLELLDAVREEAGIRFVINSSFRTEEYNESIGGGENSAHLRGLAVDIKADTSFKKFAIVNAALTLNVRRIGIGSNFVHIDNDLSLPHPVIWTY